MLDLTDLREDSLTVDVLRETFQEQEVRVDGALRVPVRDASRRESPSTRFLKRTGRRDNYLRRRKWLEKQEGYRIETHRGAAARWPGRMTDFFRLHSARWAADGGSQGIKGTGWRPSTGTPRSSSRSAAGCACTR